MHLITLSCLLMDYGEDDPECERKKKAEFAERVAKMRQNGEVINVYESENEATGKGSRKKSEKTRIFGTNKKTPNPLKEPITGFNIF